MISSDEILKLIEQGEGTRLEWKDSRILGTPFKFARSMTAMANQKGGLILIGIKDDGTIEGMKSEKEHEEHIMNIAIDRCQPPITPEFQKVRISPEADVYLLTIPKKKGDVCHGVKTRDGLVYFIRVGSRIREIRPEELSKPRPKGVQIEPYTPTEKGILWLSERLLMIVSTHLNFSLARGMLILFAIGILSIAGALLLIFRIEDSMLVLRTANYPWWVNTLIFVWLIFGAYLSLSLPTSALETKCPTCRQFFTYRRVRSEILKKRTISRDLEEWKIHNFYRCNACGYEDDELKYEKHRTD